MNTVPTSDSESSIMRLYTVEAGLRHIANTLPEEDAGLALLVRCLAAEVLAVTIQLDNAE